jgi:hypothetical protein
VNDEVDEVDEELLDLRGQTVFCRRGILAHANLTSQKKH